MTVPRDTAPDAGEKFYRRVLADVNGKATDEEAEALRADMDTIREWRAVLTRMVQDHDTALTRIRSETETRQQQSLSAGPAAKDAFYQFKASQERQRAGLVRQKAAIVERLKEAKDAITTLGAEENDGKVGRTWARLDAIEAKLDQLLAMIEEMRHAR